MRDSRGGGIGLEPVYAEDVTLNVSNGKITAGSVSGNINGTVGSTAITDGTITGGNLSGGTFTGTVTLTGADIKNAIADVDISKAKVGSDATSLTIGGLASAVETNKASIDTLNSTVGSTSNEGSLVHKTQKITYAAGTGTTVDGVVLKDKGITAAGGKFKVDGTNAETVVSGDNGKTTIYGGGITVDSADNNSHVLINNGTVNATLSVISPNFFVDLNNVFAANSLKVGDGTNGVTITDGKITTTGDTTVGGNLTVKGEANFAKATTFAGGIKTDTISENTDGEGVTVDGVVLKDGGITATGNVTTTGDIQGKDINATGALKGQTLGIGTNGSEFTVDETGNTKVGGTLDVTGATTLKDTLNVKGATTLGSTLNVAGKTTLRDDLQVDKIATFGIATGANTVIEGDVVKTGRIETSDSQASKIGGVTLLNGKVTATDMTVTGTIDFNNLKVNNELTVGTNTKITEGTLQLGIADDNKLTAEKLANINQTIKANRVIDATSAIIGGVEIKGGNVTATGTVQGQTIYDGVGAKLENGKITAKEGQIGNVTISAAGAVTGVSEIKATTFEVDGNNFLNSNGITAKGGKIGGAVINETTLSVGSTKLDKADGITTNKLKIDGMTLTDTKLDTGTATFEVNGVTFNQGQVTAKAAQGFVAGTSSFKEGSLIVDANNKLEATNGLTTEKATVKGNLDVTGQATFGTVDNQTTINGKTVTTDILKANRLILGTSGDATVEVDKDGSLIAAKGKFKVDKDGKTTFTKDAYNLSSINGGNICAKATDIADNTSSELTHDYKGLHIKGNKSGQKSAFDFDTSTGIGTFTGQDNSTTKINGSAIRSEKSDGTAGKLDGENLTLYKDPNNQTTMSAGKATFTGDAGEKGGKVTTINGGTISTDTLNVERINLGEDILDSNGNPHGSNLSMDKQGNFSAAGGNFKVTGGSGADKGAFTNTVGNTTLQTDNAGASMKFDNTAADGGVESKVTVEANKATVAAGEKASFVATTDNGGTATITGGTQTVTTTDKGTVFENSAHKTAFVDNGATNTIINGNEITTGKITTDQLVITGKGNADGNGGSIAFGGNGTIKSDINDGTTNGKNTSFETTLDGVNTKVTDGTTTTENKVTAEGNSNIVKQDDTHKSEFNQGLTSIGGVVTNGEIKVAQKLDGATGLLTNEVTDANGSSKLEQSGTGLTYTDSAKPDNATRIDSSDVSIGSKENEKDRINLSDLGQIDDLHSELKSREEFTSNPTAVGGINAEAAIRREEVARLDGRINDVNDRVNKVGAMAAAIASLKSIGYDPQAPSEFSIGLGQYKGETGVAMGFFHYPNKNFMINVSLSTAGGETMGGIGATWRFGHKSPQKLLEEQREEQAKKELAAAEKYQAAAKLAKEAQERAEYAAKLARQAQVSADNAKAAADATQAKHFG